MEISIRAAAQDEFDNVRAFYHAVTDGLKNAQYGPGWKKDIYPTPEELRAALVDGSLYIAEALKPMTVSEASSVKPEEGKPASVSESAGTDSGAGRIIAAMVINHSSNEAYRNVRWPEQLAPEEYLVIHMLGVHPGFNRQGIAKEMVRFAIDTARKDGLRAIRLDVLNGNIPAEQLYLGLGFSYVETVPMYYDDTGWTDYMVYEYLL